MCSSSISEVCQNHRVNVHIPLYLWSTSCIGMMHLCMFGPSGGMSCTDVSQGRWPVVSCSPYSCDGKWYTFGHLCKLLLASPASPRRLKQLSHSRIPLQHTRTNAGIRNVDKKKIEKKFLFNRNMDWYLITSVLQVAAKLMAANLLLRLVLSKIPFLGNTIFFPQVCNTVVVMFQSGDWSSVHNSPKLHRNPCKPVSCCVLSTHVLSTHILSTHAD